MRRTYGLADESTKDVTKEKREEVTREVFRLFDVDRNGVIEKEEWMQKCKEGVRLPDFGVSLLSIFRAGESLNCTVFVLYGLLIWSFAQLGPSHHGDDEYEYEIHHFEKFHDESEFKTPSVRLISKLITLLTCTKDTKEEDLTHPEDIAHFAKHDREEVEAEHQEQLNKLPINEANIPQMFRRQP